MCFCVFGYIINSVVGRNQKQKRKLNTETFARKRTLEVEVQFGSASTAVFYVFTRFQFFFFFLLQPHLLTKSAVNRASMHCLQVPQITLFSNFFIKNGSHDIIYTFKNYFVTIFSVFSFSKISSIQTDPSKKKKK